MDSLMLRRRVLLGLLKEEYIIFADPVVEQICATNWGDGIGLKPSQAARVTSIGSNVFQSNTSITSFEELKYFTGLTTISNVVFKSCSNLSVIGVPPNLTQFGMQGVPITEIDITDLSAYLNVTTFNNGSYCLTTGSPSTGAHLYLNGTEVTSVTYPSGTTSIPKYKWYRHAYITSITLPSSLTSIGDCAFYGCSSLTAIEIPSGVTVLRPSTFRDCYSLATLTLNGPVSVVNGYVFQSCSSLKRVNVQSAADWMDCVWMGTNYCWPGGGSNELHIYPINSNTEITSFTIPNTKTTIESCAFRDCINVTSVTIPSSITSIKSWAFCHSGISGTIVIPATVTTLEDNVFRDCQNITNLCIYKASISSHVISSTQNIVTGNGTGILYMKNVTSNCRENNFRFKHIIVDGNFEYTQQNYWLRGSNCEALRIYGNCTMNHASRATQLTYDDTWKLIEILGQFVDANSQGASICLSARVPSGAIVHLGYNGVAATPAQVNASQANLSKVYVGDGSSQAADEAVLALYLADSNWSQYSSKLDIWYNYNGDYKTPPTIPT